MNIRGGGHIAEVIDKALQVSKKMVDVLGFWAAFHVTILQDLRNWWISCTNLFLSLFDSCHSVLQEKPRKMIKLSRIIWDAWLNHRDAVCWWGLEGQKGLGIKGAIGCWGASRPGETKNREEKISPSEWPLRFWIWQSVHWSNLVSMDLWFILKILKLIFVLHSWAIRIQNRLWLPKLCGAFPVGPSNTFRDCRVQRHYDLPCCFRFHIVSYCHIEALCQIYASFANKPSWGQTGDPLVYDDGTQVSENTDPGGTKWKVERGRDCHSSVLFQQCCFTSFRLCLFWTKCCSCGQGKEVGELTEGIANLAKQLLALSMCCVGRWADLLQKHKKRCYLPVKEYRHWWCDLMMWICEQRTSK